MADISGEACDDQDRALILAFQSASILYRRLSLHWNQSGPPYLQRNLRYRHPRTVRRRCLRNVQHTLLSHHNQFSTCHSSSAGWYPTTESMPVGNRASTDPTEYHSLSLLPNMTLPNQVKNDTIRTFKSERMLGFSEIQKKSYQGTQNINYENQHCTFWTNLKHGYFNQNVYFSIPSLSQVDENLANRKEAVSALDGMQCKIEVKIYPWSKEVENSVSPKPLFAELHYPGDNSVVFPMPASEMGMLDINLSLINEQKLNDPATYSLAHIPVRPLLYNMDKRLGVSSTVLLAPKLSQPSIMLTNHKNHFRHADLNFSKQGNLLLTFKFQIHWDGSENPNAHEDDGVSRKEVLNGWFASESIISGLQCSFFHHKDVDKGCGHRAHNGSISFSIPIECRNSNCKQNSLTLSEYADVFRSVTHNQLHCTSSNEQDKFPQEPKLKQQGGDDHTIEQGHHHPSNSQPSCDLKSYHDHVSGHHRKIDTKHSKWIRPFKEIVEEDPKAECILILRNRLHEWKISMSPALICPWCKCRSKSVYELIFHVAFTHPRFLVTTEANNDQFKLIISLCETPPLHLNSRVIRDNEKESFYYKSLGASSENAAAKGVILPIHIEASALNSYLDLNHFLHKNQHRIVLSEARASKARSYFHMPFAENMHPEYNADSEDDVEDDMGHVSQTFGIAREWSLFIASQPIASKRNIKELCIQFAKKYPVLVQKSHYMFMQHLHVLFESHSLDGEDIADILRIINQ